MSGPLLTTLVVAALVVLFLGALWVEAHELLDLDVDNLGCPLCKRLDCDGSLTLCPERWAQ